MSYPVKLISYDEKDLLYQQYSSYPFHTAKADISGCCIKLYTLSSSVKDMWEDNFYSMSETVRSHGRLICLEDADRPLEVLFEPNTKTAFLFNFDYYGWIKSVALALAGDILEDEHQIYSVHGAALDIGGKGITLIAPSKTGKTTHSWGLLRSKERQLWTPFSKAPIPSVLPPQRLTLPWAAGYRSLMQWCTGLGHLVLKQAS